LLLSLLVVASTGAAAAKTTYGCGELVVIHRTSGNLKRFPMDRLLQFLVSSSERAKRLRQSNPFFAVLSRDEKARLIGGAGDDHDPGPA
jgi:hypothetical protein